MRKGGNTLSRRNWWFESPAAPPRHRPTEGQRESCFGGYQGFHRLGVCREKLKGPVRVSLKASDPRGKARSARIAGGRDWTCRGRLLVPMNQEPRRAPARFAEHPE